MASTVYRTSGLVLLAGAVCAIIGNVLGSVLFPGNDPHQYTNMLWVVITLLNLVGSALLLLGLPAVAARQAHSGWLGLVGYTLTFLGGFLFSSFSVILLLVLPWLAQAAPKLAAENGGPPALFIFFLIAGVLFAVGGLLLGIAIMRAKVFPRWAGLMLLIGAVLNLVTFPLNGVIGSILSTLAFVLFAGAFGWMGYSLMSASRAEKVEAVAASSGVSA